MTAGGIVAAILCCALGVGIGVLVRNQVAAVVGALLVLGAWAAVFMLAALLVDARRDVD